MSGQKLDQIIKEPIRLWFKSLLVNAMVQVSGNRPIMALLFFFFYYIDGLYRRQYLLLKFNLPL